MQAATHMPLSESLPKAVEKTYHDWLNQTKFYGTVSSVLRVALIISTSLVAAQATLKWGPSERLFPWLSVLVAITTAFDSWLKPRDKWRGFMSDRDDVNVLRLNLLATDPTDTAKLAGYLEEFHAILKRHTEKHVY